MASFPRRVAITGAAGALGGALAAELAKRGAAVSLCDSDGSSLNHLRERLLAGGNSVEVSSFDVRDRDAFRAWLERGVCGLTPDWVVLAAGLGGPVPEGAVIEPDERASAILSVNLEAVVHQTNAVLESLAGVDGGRIVYVSSLAAVLGNPAAPVYAASKAGVLAFARSIAARSDKVGVTVALPGFLTAAMSGSRSAWRPFAMSPDEAAKRIIRAAQSGRGEVPFPMSMVLALRALALLPPATRAAVYRACSGSAKSTDSRPRESADRQQTNHRRP
ncbi:MAG: SDR family NAD(P)-dependent oxidoreductase [Pseudomonadota bacterium]